MNRPCHSWIPFVDRYRLLDIQHFTLIWFIPTFWATFRFVQHLSLCNLPFILCAKFQSLENFIRCCIPSSYCSTFHSTNHTFGALIYSVQKFILIQAQVTFYSLQDLIQISFSIWWSFFHFVQFRSVQEISFHKTSYSLQQFYLCLTQFRARWNFIFNFDSAIPSVQHCNYSTFNCVQHSILHNSSFCVPFQEMLICQYYKVGIMMCVIHKVPDHLAAITKYRLSLIFLLRLISCLHMWSLALIDQLDPVDWLIIPSN